MIRVIHYGLGPIGIGIARQIASRTGMRIVGAIDIDPQKAGKDLSVLIGAAEPLGVVVGGDAAVVLSTVAADIAVLATSSSIEKIVPQIRQLAEAGLSVISTCEELSYPPAGNSGLAQDLDALARKNHIAIYGTGVNPGFAMDALPLMLTAACADVKAIRVERVVDAATRRLPLQTKVGAGITPEQFRQRVADGSVRHVGLRESAFMIAQSFRWTLGDYQEHIEPVIAGEQVTTSYRVVARGNVAGVHQIGRGYAGGREVITLDLSMYVGAQRPHDSVWITGNPNLHMAIEGGLHGDVATAAIVVNSIPRVLGAAPGLLTPNNLPIPHWRAG